MDQVSATLYSALAALLVGLLNIVLTANRTKLEGVTQHRVQWIQDLRTLTVQVLSFHISSELNYEEQKSAFSVLKEESYHLALYLNPMGPFDCVIFNYLAKYIKNIEFQLGKEKNVEYDNNIKKYRRLLDLSVRIYLKAEWNRVKWENKVIRRLNDNSKREDKFIKGILNSFDNDDKCIKMIKNDYESELSIVSAGNMSPIFFADLFDFNLDKLSQAIDTVFAEQKASGRKVKRFR